MRHHTRKIAAFLLSLAFLLILTVMVQAQETTVQDVKLGWTHTQEADPAMPITFRIYGAPITTPETWKVLKQDLAGKEATVTLAPGIWRLQIRSAVAGLESKPSEILEVKIYPTPPGQATRVAVQTSTDLKSWQDSAVAYLSPPAGGKLFVRSTITSGADATKAAALDAFVGPTLTN